MRLTPIYSPQSLFLKIVYYVSRKRYGKVLAPFTTIYARSTPLLKMVFTIVKIEKKLGIEASLRLLIRNFVSHLNECSFCSNLMEFEAQKNNIEVQKIMDMMNFRQSTQVTRQEKALFSYLEEITFTKTATDDCFAELKKHFTEQQIVEITWLAATENYFNSMAKPLGLKSDNLK